MVKCYSGYAYVATGISLGIGGLMTTRWILWKDQPVPLWADALYGASATLTSGYGLYQLATGKGCKTYKSIKKRQKKNKMSLKKTALYALAIGVPMAGLISYSALSGIPIIGSR